MIRAMRRAAVLLVAVAVQITGLTGQSRPAQAAVFDEKPDVTCTSEEYPQLASDMADFVRIAVNVGTVVRYDGPHRPGVAFYDRATGIECYSSPDQIFKTASLVKASILGALLYRPQEISDAERPLVQKMILESDNDTALTLWKDSLGCGKDENGDVRPCTLYRNFLDAAGMDGTYPDDGGAFGDTYTTARDQVRLFKLFSAENAVINAERRAYAQDLLQRAEPRFGVTSSAPPGTVQQLKVGFSKLGEDSDAWRVNAAGRVHGGAQGYDYIVALLSDRNEEIPHNPWPFNGIERLDQVGKQINCGIRELNGDTSCWSFKSDDCIMPSPVMSCETDEPVRSHRSQHWIRVDIGAKLGSTVHWKLVDAANGIVVDEGDAVGGPSCVCDKTVYGLYGSYILRLQTDAANGGDRGALYNHTGGWPDPDANQPPTVNAGPDRTGEEGSPVSVTGFANDDGGAPRVQWSARPGADVDPGGSCTFADPTALRTTVTCNDDGAFVISLTADDGVNAAVHDDAIVRVANVAPGLAPGQRTAQAASQLSAPRPWQLFRAGQSVTVTAPFVDPGSNDTQTCRIVWDDGTVDSFPASDSGCNRTHTYHHAGMYTIKLDVADDDEGQDNAGVMIVVYDPEAGFTNADGSLASPTGAWTSSPDTSGEAWFHLTAKYYPSRPDVPVGTAQTWLAGTGFRFNAGDGNLEWLVATPDGMTAAKGTGTLQNQSGRHGFVFYGYDGCANGTTPGCRPGPDRFRMVVWPLSKGPNPEGDVVYDNVPTADYDLDVARPQPLRSGIVTIHPPV